MVAGLQSIIKFIIQIRKNVNTNDELIQFTDLKKGTRISMRLWIKEKTLYNDMDRLDIVTLIQCCE